MRERRGERRQTERERARERQRQGIEFYGIYMRTVSTLREAYPVAPNCCDYEPQPFLEE